MFRDVFYCFLQFVHISDCYYQYPYPLNSTQNHLINSTLPIFNLSTQPSIMPGCKHPKTKKSESRKRTPNSRKCLVFKPFSVFTFVFLTSRLRTRHVQSVGTYPPAARRQAKNRPRRESLHPGRELQDCRKHKRAV